MSLMDGPRDEVKVILNGKETFIVKRYRAELAMLTQPAHFEVSLGSPSFAKDLMREFPPNTPFELQIAGTTQFKGKTDGYRLDDSEGTGLSIFGRDTLAPLHDYRARAAKTFSDMSLVDLTKWALDLVYGKGNYQLGASNVANRAALSNTVRKGKKGSATTKNAALLTPTSDGSDTTSNIPAAAQGQGIDELFITRAKNANKKIQVKAGQLIYGDVLKPQYDRAGLVLLALGDGSGFLLTHLGADQAPLYNFRFSRDLLTNTLEGREFDNNMAMRFSEYIALGRQGGGKSTVTTMRARLVDEEVRAAGIDRPFVLDDEKSLSEEQLEFKIRRKMGEDRRNGRKHAYRVGGHTTSTTDGGLAIWVPDTVVNLDDDEIDAHGPHYIERVEHLGEPFMITRITLMRPSDVEAMGGDDE